MVLKKRDIVSRKKLGPSYSIIQVENHGFRRKTWRESYSLIFKGGQSLKLCKKALFILLSAFILLFAVGCQKDSALPKNESETLSEKTTLDEPVKEDPEIKGNKENGSIEEGNAENNPKENEVKATTESKQANPSTDKGTKNTSKKQENSNTNTANKSNTQTSKSVKNKSTTPAPKTKSGQPVTAGGQNSAPAPKSRKDTVTVSVNGYRGPINAPIPTVFLSPTKVEIEPGDTALDATLKILKDKEIQISVRGSGATAYVEGINNIYEFDYGPLSGWLIEVNDILIDNSAGIEPIKNGDKIEWIYTLDYTKDTTY